MLGLLARSWWILTFFGLILIVWIDSQTLASNHLVALGTAISGALAIIAAFRLGNWSDQPAPRAR
jgi:hypothetical protein